MASSSSSAAQRGLGPATSQSLQSLPSRDQLPIEYHCLVMTYNIGANEDKAFSNKKQKTRFTDKLRREIIRMTQTCHVIFIQEIAMVWSTILKSLLPPGWTLLWSQGTVAVLFRQSDWASWHADHNIRMFPKRQDDNNPCRHWRNFLEASQVVGTIACYRLFVFCFISLYVYIALNTCIMCVWCIEILLASFFWFFFLCLVCFADLHIFVCVFSLCTH